MQVKLLRDYKCAPEGHTVYSYGKGAIIEGVAAELALQDGAAEPMQAEPAKPAPKKKRTPKPKVIKPAEPDQEG